MQYLSRLDPKPATGEASSLGQGVGCLEAVIEVDISAVNIGAQSV